MSYEHFLHSNSQKSCKQNWHFQNEWTEKQIYISGCSILLRRWQFIQSLNVKPKCIMTLFIMDWKLALFVWVVGFFSLLFKFKFTKKFLVYYIDWFLYVARLFAIWFYLNVFVVVITLYYFIFCLLRSIYFACDDFKKTYFVSLQLFPRNFFFVAITHTGPSKIDRVTQIGQNKNFFIYFSCALSIIVSRP